MMARITKFGILIFQFLQRLSLVLVHEFEFSNGYTSANLVYYGNNFYSYKDYQALQSVSTDHFSDRRQLRKKKAVEFQLAANSSLHVCKDRNEAYSASYLVTKEHFLSQFTAFNLSWVNCEMGSYVMMYQTMLKNGKIVDLKETNGNGTLIQSIDVIDLAVIHLSTYERLYRKWIDALKKSAKKLSSKIDPIIRSGKILQNQVQMKFRQEFTLSLLKESESKNASLNLSWQKLSHKLNRTVVIMPFLGIDMGAGHSELSNRYHYLASCFWSFFSYYPHIVAAVKSPKDREFAFNRSGLPFYDVLLLDYIPKSAGLPVATVQETKQRIASGEWDFDYIFFTESDQILMMRKPLQVYSHLEKYPRHLMIPHRLMTYPEEIVRFHKRAVVRRPDLQWLNMSCCLPRQKCSERKSWIHVSNSSMPLLSVYGLQVALGNANFHKETYRACSLSETRVDDCP